MKKIITTLILVLSSVVVVHTQEHLQFMGITFDRTVDEFSKQLMNKGFTLDDENNQSFQRSHQNKIALNGVFCNYASHVTLFGTGITKTVYSVYVKTLELDDKGKTANSREIWEMLKARYLFFKRELLDKYGHPKACVEKINKQKNIQNPLINLIEDSYYTLWDTNNGTIKLSVDNDGLLFEPGKHSYSISLIYLDSSNSSLMGKEYIELKQKEKARLQNDL